METWKGGVEKEEHHKYKVIAQFYTVQLLCIKLSLSHNIITLVIFKASVIFKGMTFLQYKIHIYTYSKIITE